LTDTVRETYDGPRGTQFQDAISRRAHRVRKFLSGAPFAAVFLVQRWTSLSEVVANTRGIHDNPVNEGSNSIASELRRTSWERLRADEKESVRARKLEEDFVWRRIPWFQICLSSQRKVDCTCTLRQRYLMLCSNAESSSFDFVMFSPSSRPRSQVG
jgi:hypothetical protein